MEQNEIKPSTVDESIIQTALTALVDEREKLGDVEALARQAESLDARIVQLRAILDPSKAPKPAKVKGKRMLSTVARANIAAAQVKRWSDRRAAKAAEVPGQ